MTLRRNLFWRGFLLGLGLLALAAVWGCQPSGEPPKKAEQEDKQEPPLPAQAMEHFRQGHKFLAERKMDEAYKEFQETARLAPNAALAHFWLGQIHFLRREKEQAEKEFKKVLELDKDNYHTMAMLGKIYSLERDKADQAEDYLKKALKISPDYLEAHFDLGRVYAMKGDRDRTLREFRYLFDKEREFFLYHFAMGRILEAWKDKSQALSHYKRSLQLNPQFEQASQAIQRLEKEGAATPPAPGSGAAPKPAAPAPGSGSVAPKPQAPAKPAGGR